MLGLGYSLLFSESAVEAARPVLLQYGLPAPEPVPERPFEFVVRTPRIELDLVAALERANVAFRVAASSLAELFLSVCDEE